MCIRDSFPDTVLQQSGFDFAIRLCHADTGAEIPNGCGRIPAAAQPADGRHARVVPTRNNPLLHQHLQIPLAHDRARQVQAGKFILVRRKMCIRDRCGPGIQMLRALQKAVPGVMLIASGGIRDLTDILALKDLGIYGAICGKSLYAGTLDLQELSLMHILCHSVVGHGGQYHGACGAFPVRQLRLRHAFADSGGTHDPHRDCLLYTSRCV